MKFFLDNNLSPSLCQHLARLGHQAIHSGKLGHSKAGDEVILSLAESRGSVLLTHDLDFGKILAFSGKSRPSVVIFRTQKMTVANLAGNLEKNWSIIEEPLINGAIIIIEKDDVRIRRLPIGEFNPPGFHEIHSIYKPGKPKPKTRHRKIKKIKPIKGFDALKMKEEIQRKIHKATKGMTWREEAEYFEKSALEGPFGGLYRKLLKKANNKGPNT